MIMSELHNYSRRRALEISFQKDINGLRIHFSIVELINIHMQ